MLGLVVSPYSGRLLCRILCCNSSHFSQRFLSNVIIYNSLQRGVVNSMAT